MTGGRRGRLMLAFEACGLARGWRRHDAVGRYHEAPRGGQAETDRTMIQVGRGRRGGGGGTGVVRNLRPTERGGRQKPDEVIEVARRMRRGEPDLQEQPEDRDPGVGAPEVADNDGHFETLTIVISLTQAVSEKSLG